MNSIASREELTSPLGCSNVVVPRVVHKQLTCCCCRHTPPCLFGGVLPYFEVTGHPVPAFSLGFKCPDCFIWNCSNIVYPSKMVRCVEGIHRELVSCIVLITETAIEQSPSVGHLTTYLIRMFALIYISWRSGPKPDFCSSSPIYVLRVCGHMM